MASFPKKPAEMTDAEQLLMDTAMSSYRHVKQPADDAFDAMLKSMQSPFDVSTLRCTDERQAAAACFKRATTNTDEQAMVTAALKCREPVLALERCGHALEAQAFALMREGHKRMEAAKRQQQEGPVLNTE
jgi:23S rRNA pseudoU1915 N3-methylase RlmH